MRQPGQSGRTPTAVQSARIALAFAAGWLCSQYWYDSVSFVDRDEFSNLLDAAASYEISAAHWNAEITDELASMRVIQRGTMLHPRTVLFGSPKRQLYVLTGSGEVKQRD